MRQSTKRVKTFFTKTVSARSSTIVAIRQAYTCTISGERSHTATELMFVGEKRHQTKALFENKTPQKKVRVRGLRIEKGNISKLKEGLP